MHTSNVRVGQLLLLAVPLCYSAQPPEEKNESKRELIKKNPRLKIKTSPTKEAVIACILRHPYHDPEQIKQMEEDLAYIPVPRTAKAASPLKDK